ncbi:SiaB family protein kinase [Hugenholtzia roseola]|uniref:SiaB family protein kinase n=1 Tax=Hugenholtzia roseola TaxID=1002 RepID=UPI00040A6CB1|nr:SiaB family protein kinase [Hugenholtzia roseola]
MKVAPLDHLHAHLLQQHVLMSFHGVMSQEMLSFIAAQIQACETDIMLGNRLFAVVIELAQNISKYSKDQRFSVLERKNIGFGLIAIVETEQAYHIHANNLSDLEHISTILQRCAHISSLSPNDLRRYYRQQRKVPRTDGKKGGNIGLIEMARKASQPLEVKTFPTQEADLFYCHIEVTLEKNRAH